MKIAYMAAAVALALGVAGCSTVSDAGDQVKDAVTDLAAPAAPQLHQAMRGLWHEHIVALRDYAQAVHAGDLAAMQAAVNAAVANGHDIAGAVAGFYGAEVEEPTFDLLAGHATGVIHLTDAIEAGNEAEQDRIMSELAQNALQIADFFASANPDNWTVDGLNQALLMHVGDHEQQIALMMADAPAAEQEEAWQHMQEHMDMIADALSDGLAKQFPDKVN